MGDFSLGFIEAIASRNGSPIYLDENAIAPFNSLMETEARVVYGAEIAIIHV
jgi:hypothetical protein